MYLVSDEMADEVIEALGKVIADAKLRGYTEEQILVFLGRFALNMDQWVLPVVRQDITELFRTPD